jgi:hypothetical protein
MSVIGSLRASGEMFRARGGQVAGAGWIRAQHDMDCHAIHHG